MTKAVTPPLTVAPEEEMQRVSFDDGMEEEIASVLERYPTKQAAILPLLWISQQRWGWISPAVIAAIASRLELSPAFVEGVTSFYTMYHRKPPGRYVLQVCTTISCQLCGTRTLVEHLRQKLEIDFGETTSDGRFTLVDVQCLGACGDAPIIQINDDYYDALTIEKLDELLDQLS